METTTCPGLRASWINGWLAAVGATFLDDRIRLHWTEESSPAAVFSARTIAPLLALVSSWPTTDQLRDLPLASDWRGLLPPIKRKVKVEEFSARMRAARSHPHSWSLSSTMTDLAVDKNGEVAHAPFDPAGPGTIKWLHNRLMKLHSALNSPSESRIEDSVAGRAARIEDNGLGFDQARLGSLADESKPLVDPVVEILAFFGLSMLPVRGPGYEQLGSRRRMNEIQRGWSAAKGEERTLSFRWPGWRQPLDFYGIDALLDIWKPGVKNSWSRHGVHAGWKTVRFSPRGSSDTTRAFGSARL